MVSRDPLDTHSPGVDCSTWVGYEYPFIGVDSLELGSRLDWDESVFRFFSIFPDLSWSQFALVV